MGGAESSAGLDPSSDSWLGRNPRSSRELEAEQRVVAGTHLIGLGGRVEGRRQVQKIGRAHV